MRGRRWMPIDDALDPDVAPRIRQLPPGFERLLCVQCGDEWVRQVKRGVKPTRCPPCR